MIDAEELEKKQNELLKMIDTLAEKNDNIKAQADHVYKEEEYMSNM